MNSKPMELDQLDRNIRQLEIERESLKKEKDPSSKKRLKDIEKEHAELKEAQKELGARWQNEKDVIDIIKSSNKEVDTLKMQESRAEREGNLQRVAEIRYGLLPALEKNIAKAKRDLANVQKGNPILKEEVTEEDIAKIVARWTGIPVTKMLKTESEKLKEMEKELSKRIVGQEEAVKAVSNAVRRSRAGIQEEGRPIGSFLFLGPTGVGKTELAKALAEFLFNDENLLTRMDMSEYMESHSIAKLIGSPPGYVGYEEGGQLTEAVRRHPYTVILLDEIEKAHHDVFNILLQIMDDGRLTDTKGRTVNFKNTVIIMTSNLDGDVALKKTFRPEFLNRLDETIIFQPLTEKQIENIVDLQIHRIQKRLVKKEISLIVSMEAKKHLAERGYDPMFGARPLKRVIQNDILDELSLRIIEGKIKEGDTVKVEMKDNAINIE